MAYEAADVGSNPTEGTIAPPMDGSWPSKPQHVGSIPTGAANKGEACDRQRKLYMTSGFALKCAREYAKSKTG